jgi:2',3'-cyclic-nucleotide 2'-phosphodiesterase (5'-nucleotidase family)
VRPMLAGGAPVRSRRFRFAAPFMAVALLGSLIPSAASPALAASTINFTILHTNDVHGQLEASGSNPGMARVAAVVNGVRASVGAANTLLVDAGDEMQGSLLSNLQKGAPTIGTFNALAYDVATFGNHEFDWGQTVLGDRVTQSTFPHVSANIVSGSCDAGNWAKPSFVSAPYVVKEIGTAPNTVKVAFIGVTTTETPTITIASSTAGLCFKDPAVSISHYYADMKAKADVVVVLSHLGFNDGGYGYGIPVYGDKTLAQKLIDAGNQVPLIIGGHSHTDLGPLAGTPLPTNMPAAYTVVGGKTSVVQAYYNGRRVGDASLTFDPATKAVTVGWQSLIVDPAGAKDPTVDALINGFASDPTYQALINKPIGYSAVDLPRLGGTVDNMMGTFVDDAIYNYLNTDSPTTNDIDVFFNNAGGIRTDWCYKGTTWVNTGCVGGTHAPALLTYGNMFTILPFGNATVVGDMTGAQILQVLNHGPQIVGVIQPAGVKYKYYGYKDANPGPQPYAWGVFDYCVVNKTTKACDPLDLKKTYKVGTNEFLAPAGGDGYSAFKYMTNITYWGDMLDAVNGYVSAHYTFANPYKGPSGDGTLDGRITRDGTDAGGSVVPITILHNNDSHGNLAKGTFVGMTQLATLIKQEQAHNPTRTLLLNGGDQIQGDAMSYYFKSAPSGFASDGTALPATLRTNPMMAVMNALGYDAMTLGNHEFNFGSSIFTGIFKQAKFPLLGANVSDTGAYGLSQVGPGGQGVQPYIEKTLGGIKIAILGITNHRVPNYELPSNILGLTFSNPITTAQAITPTLKARDDVVIALTHIGFTTNPKSVEVDNNVDTNFAADVPGVDAIVGAHSHTNPAYPEAPYKFLPTIVAGPNNTPVIINQAYRFNNTLGEEVIGVRPKIQLTIEDVQRLFAQKAIDNAGIRNSLLDKLAYAKTLFDGGQIQAAINQLNAFINSVKAQSGKNITKAAAATLIGDASWMIAHKGGYAVVARAGQYLSVLPSTPEDPAIKAIVDPYVAQLSTYTNTGVGQTTVPIDTTSAYVAETNAANLQADAAVYELAKNGITDVDVHLSGAMTQSNPKILFPTATLASPVPLKVSDMFTFMPYENSLVVLRMNGPQIKAVLERGYRNYYYYKYVPGYGGYSHYTTCMLDTNKVGRITYAQKAGVLSTPPLPDGSNVVSFTINETPVNFTNATTFYNVSTVNYLAAGSCNFNNGGVSLWPLSQIVHDTQYYVRDAVINYIKAQPGPISPAIEGRLIFK